VDHSRGAANGADIRKEEPAVSSLAHRGYIHLGMDVKSGQNQPTIAPLQAVLPSIEAFDRTTINAWEDIETQRAIKATDRKKLVMTALWTEAGRLKSLRRSFSANDQ
jgi:hypothetical protein